jgi:hypothetical protein
MKRYRLRIGSEGWQVYDIWTGQPVRLGTGHGGDLEAQAAEVLANVLNKRAREGDRKVFQ